MRFLIDVLRRRKFYCKGRGYTSDNDFDGWDSSHSYNVDCRGLKMILNIKFLSSEIISWENIGKMIDCIEEKLK